MRTTARGTPTTSIYRRFDGKLSLVLWALQEEFDSFELDLPDHGDLRGGLLAYTRQITEGLSPRRSRILAGLLLRMRDIPELASFVSSKLPQASADIWSALVEWAVGRGELDDRHGMEMISTVAPILIDRAITFGRTIDDRFLTALVDDVLLPPWCASAGVLPRLTISPTLRRPRVAQASGSRAPAWTRGDFPRQPPRHGPSPPALRDACRRLPDLHARTIPWGQPLRWARPQCFPKRYAPAGSISVPAS
ncbi:TetR-like C-terminal domain-containing protein [Streptomyces sp. NPDC048751]|uniref:TetR-like C-terminal domain-containing protein n=1 Tax=Streptomyces sp. NPDC048751 TaxID=3365591 RepID=UPI0037136797